MSVIGTVAFIKKPSRLPGSGNAGRRAHVSTVRLANHSYRLQRTTRIGIVLCARCDPPKCLNRIDDIDALMAVQGKEMLAIPRDKKVGAGRDSSGNDVIVIDITAHHPRYAGHLDQLDSLDIISQHLVS